MKIKDILNLLRVHQWVKNLFIFAALFFTSNLFNVGYFLKVFAGFFFFSLTASAGYIFNDIKDVEKDRIHPFKRNRPVASGKISKKTAALISLILVFSAIPGAFLLNFDFGFVLFLYLVLSTAYSVFLKKLSFIDMFMVALFFVMRVYSGAVILNVPASSYLIIMTFLLAFFIVAGKRLHDKTLLGKTDKLRPFKIYLIFSLLAIVFFYALYVRYLYLVKHIGPLPFLVASMIFVIFGMSRLLILLFSGKNLEKSFDGLMFDRYILLSVFLWILVLIPPFYHVCF